MTQSKTASDRLSVSSTAYAFIKLGGPDIAEAKKFGQAQLEWVMNAAKGLRKYLTTATGGSGGLGGRVGQQGIGTPAGSGNQRPQW